MPADQTVLLSVRPWFAEALLNGTKTVEVRRRLVRLGPGAICLVYASSPTCALTGALTVAGVEHGSPDQLWARHGECTALARGEYDAYLEGRPVASAVIVARAIAFAKPVQLDELRRRSNTFIAPQSYRFMDSRELSAVLNGQAAEVSTLAAQSTHTGFAR